MRLHRGKSTIVHDFRNGRTAETILDAYPSVGQLVKVYGAITFILEHPDEVENYLDAQNRRYEEFKAVNPLTPDMIERVQRGQRELLAKSS